MSVNGIWKIEMLGPYGWEPTATAYLEDGKYKGGSRNHYAAGSYEVTGNQIVIAASYVVHGEARTMFGKKVSNLDLELTGEIDGDRIQGPAREQGSNVHVTFRATRLADLP